MHADPFLVQIRHRPRRIAFVVDPENCPDVLLDEIVDFNVCSWGGRYNPIIPLVDAEVPESYWPFLDVVNPDVIYSYCELSAKVIERFLIQIRPLELTIHKFLNPDSPFRVRIGEQASVLPLLKRVTDRFPTWSRKPEPAVAVFDFNSQSEVSPFVRRNFGAESQFEIWSNHYNIPSQRLQPSDVDVLKALGSNPHLVTPMDLCADSPRTYRADTEEYGVALTICYGASPWNFIEYWNLVHFSDGAFSGFKPLREIWAPKALFEEPSLYQGFLEFVRRRGPSGQSRVRLTSYDETMERMRELTQTLCKDPRLNIYPAEPVIRTKGVLPTFRCRSAANMFQPRHFQPQHEQLSGEQTLLRLDPPDDAPPEVDEKWIVEFAVEEPDQERFFSNKEAWWKLPKKQGVGNLFFPHLRCRIGNDHLTCAEVSGQGLNVYLRTPTVATLMQALLLPSVFAPEWCRSLVPDLFPRQLNTLYVRLSDKGKYVQGVLGLFESLRKAAYVFEHEFWRHEIECMAVPRISEQVRNKVRRRLQEIDIEGLAQTSLDTLVDEVLDAAGRVQRPSPYVNFDALANRYLEYLRGLGQDERLLEVRINDPGQSPGPNDKVFRDAAFANIRLMLGELTTRKVLLQGAEIQCTHCLAALWYHVDDLRSMLICRGCRREVNLPPEVHWSYALNELIGSAVRDHGVVPVIRTAYRLFTDSRECFLFIPGAEIRDYRADPEVQVGELDLMWIRDGEFGVAEVKRTPKRFSIQKELAMVLNAARPDRLLLVSSSGTDENMKEASSAIMSSVDPSIKVEWWSPNRFQKSTHHGWDSELIHLFP